MDGRKKWMIAMAVLLVVLIIVIPCVVLLLPKCFPLDMALDSVDNMYDGCDGRMAAKVATEYLPNEKNKHKDFKTAWDAAVVWYNRGGMNPIVGREEAIALRVYTSAREDIYKHFNEAVRTQRSRYQTDFRFHALHFYLTRAVKKLNHQGGCRTVSRRTNVSFHQDVGNTQVRFGSFTSSSKFPLQQKTYTERVFGDKSCFEIETCMGADVSRFSIYQSEEEVLIPPYEVFQVTDVKKKSKQKDLPCDVVYSLKSTRTSLSDLNCAL